MSVITVFSGTFCNEDSVLHALMGQTGFKPVNDADLIAQASQLSGLAEDRIGRTFTARASVFNKFTHERERATAYLRLALAQLLSDDQLLISGFAGQLIDRDINHVLRACLIADLKTRTAAAATALRCRRTTPRN